MAGLHQPEAVGELEGQLHIMGGEENALVLLMSQTAEHLERLYLAREIEEGGGFI